MDEVTGDQALEAVRTLLRYIGEDPNREGLVDTPKRVLKAWKESWGKGYTDESPTVTVFEDGSENYDEIIVVRDVDIWSTCEHHLAPFFGKMSLAYLPEGNRIIGLSKVARISEHLSRRLQVQERLTTGIAQWMMNTCKPKGVAVVLECRHLCMESRGVSKKGAMTVTSAVLGSMRESVSIRAEALDLLRRDNGGSRGL